MSHSNYLYQHLLNSFQSYSIDELITLNNEIVQSNWGSSKGTFRSAILNTLSKRGIDLSKIINRNDGFTTVLIAPVKLADNSLIPL